MAPKRRNKVLWLELSAGVVLFLLLIWGGLYWLGAVRWDESTRELRARIEAAKGPKATAVYHPRELEGLPAPVQRYFRTVLKEGQPIVAAAYLQHVGDFNMSADKEQWRRFTSTQRVVTQRPGFDWDGHIIAVPGMPVRAHDAYVAGEGVLHVSLLGLVTLANMRGAGGEARGQLMRFLAEAPWYPTALLPSQGVRWEPLDAHSARATLTDGDLSLSLVFHFSEAGYLDSMFAEGRARTVGNKLVQTPWQGKFWNYEERGGMRVPLEGEVAWLLPEGPKPYWRGRATMVEYEWVRSGL
jgi:hypothetical protein